MTLKLSDISHGTHPQYSLVVDEDVKKLTKQTPKISYSCMLSVMVNPQTGTVNLSAQKSTLYYGAHSRILYNTDQGLRQFTKSFYRLCFRMC